jgi:CxxC-x17-CxxC domain-containing protein
MRAGFASGHHHDLYWAAAPRNLVAPAGGEGSVTFVDRTLVCRECGRQFVFTAGEQEFYQLKDLRTEPTRCPDCRSARKAAREGGGPAAAARREMHPAICAECGADTLVPFLPRGDKPVYCNPCYERVRDASR